MTLASVETLQQVAMFDQPALHGLLAKIRDLNLTLLYVKKVDKTVSVQRKCKYAAAHLLE
jgi:hypothetical protein